jgi:hypothetical protein
MVSRKTIGSSLAALAAAGAMLLVASTADAAMSPVPAARQSNPDIQLAWCGVGFHVGPLGACVGGGPGWRGPGWRGPGWRGPGWRHCWINNWGRRVCN